MRSSASFTSLVVAIAFFATVVVAVTVAVASFTFIDSTTELRSYGRTLHKGDGRTERKREREREREREKALGMTFNGVDTQRRKVGRSSWQLTSPGKGNLRANFHLMCTSLIHTLGAWIISRMREPRSTGSTAVYIFPTFKFKFKLQCILAWRNTQALKYNSSKLKADLLSPPSAHAASFNSAPSGSTIYQITHVTEAYRNSLHFYGWNL